jgi:hypothetical protein
MTRIIAVTLLAAASFLSPAIQAAPVTIDFEEVPDGEYFELISKGFKVSSFIFDDGGYAAGVATGFNGSNTIGGYAYGNNCDGGVCSSVSITIERDGGGQFALYDYDAFSSLGSSIGVSAILLDNPGAFQTLSDPLGTGDWLNITKVSFRVTQPYIEFPWELSEDVNLEVDNVVVSAVPVPAAVWLFASGLGLLGWFRRRRSA